MDRRAPGLAVGEDAQPPLSQYQAACLTAAAELLVRRALTAGYPG